MVNAHHDAIPFVLPTVPGGDYWRLLMDTHRPFPHERRRSDAGSTIKAAGRSLLLWELLSSHWDDDGVSE
jgi:glycogen operon protein